MDEPAYGPSEHDPNEHLALLRRLKGSHLSSSLTILSIIQGVALAALGAAVTANYSHFSLAQWIMVVVVFESIVVVWNQITIDTLTWVAVSDFQGALIPFFVGALELFLVAAITISQPLWLFGLAVLSGFSSVGLRNVSRLAAREPENAALLARVRRMRRSAHVYNVGGLLVDVALAVVALAGDPTQLDSFLGFAGAFASFAALVPGLWIAGWLWRSYWYWRKIVTYARTGA